MRKLGYGGLANSGARNFAGKTEAEKVVVVSLRIPVIPTMPEIPSLGRS